MTTDSPVINKAAVGMTYEERVQYYMKHPGYECLAGEPMEMTYEIIRRLTGKEADPKKRRSDG